MRIEEKFNVLYQKLNSKISVPVTENRRKNVLSKLTDYFVINSLDKGLNTFMILPGISTDNQFLEKLKVQCDLGRKNVCSRIKLDRNIHLN